MPNSTHWKGVATRPGANSGNHVNWRQDAAGPISMGPAVVVHLPSRRTADPVDTYLRCLGSPSSRRTQRAALDACARVLDRTARTADDIDWAALSYAEVAWLRGELVANLEPATGRRYLGAVRSVIRQAVRLGIGDPIELARIDAMPTIPLRRHTQGRILGQSEIGGLLDAAGSHQHATTAARDLCIVALLHATGMRRAELVALDVFDVDTVTGSVTIRSAKRGEQRVIWLPDWATELAVAWLAHLDDHGPLIRPINRGGAVRAQRMSTNAVGEVISRLASETGIEARCHDLRRTLITRLLECGPDCAPVDLNAVAAISGHRSLDSLRVYDRRAEAAGRVATTRLARPTV